MVERIRIAGAVLALAGMAGVAAACSSHAAAAAAGAGTSCYLTTRGAEGLAKGSLDETVDRAQAAMVELQIEPSDTTPDTGGEERELTGTYQDLDVTIELEPQTDSTTLVQVTASENLINYDRDFARRVVEEIVTSGE